MLVQHSTVTTWVPCGSSMMVCETTKPIHWGDANLLLAVQVVHFLLSGSCCSLCCMQLIAQMADLGCQVACLTVGPCIGLHAHHPSNVA